MNWSVLYRGDRIELYYKEKSRGSYKLLKKPYCDICSSPLANGSTCSWTHTHPTFAKRIYAMGYYKPTNSYRRSGEADVLSQHIYYAKRNIWKGEPLGLAIAECIKNRYPELLKFDFLVAIPRYKTEYHEDEDSGEPFNPTDILAKWINHGTGIPIITPLEKTREQKMKELSLLERKQKARGLYQYVPSPVKDKSILLIDDVSTSSSTIDECAKILVRNGGARKVCGFVCGKNDPD